MNKFLTLCPVSELVAGDEIVLKDFAIGGYSSETIESIVRKPSTMSAVKTSQKVTHLHPKSLALKVVRIAD
jgi:hypothetical protein